GPPDLHSFPTRRSSDLISNAIPETPRGGRVSVRTAGVDADEDGTLDALQIVIADTGRGMPEHVKRRLFDDPISTKPGGTGLGMRSEEHTSELQSPYDLV